MASFGHSENNRVKISSKLQFLMSIKGHYSVVIWQNILVMVYNPYFS